MGQPSSVPSIPRIDTPEQLQQRYTAIVGGYGLSPEESSWFNSVFNLFCVDSEDCNWTLSDATAYFTAIFSREMQQILAPMIPTLYTCLLRLGSVPYQHQPPPQLTRDALRYAVVVLLRRDDHHQSSLTDHDEDSTDQAQQRLDDRFRKLIFRSLAEAIKPQAEITTESVLQSTLEVDDDVFRAVSLVSRHNHRWHSNPKIVTRGPDLPPQLYFQVSGLDIESSIWSHDIWALLRLLLACQLSVAGLGPECFTNYRDDLEEATNCVFQSFVHDQDSTSGISWDSFNRRISLMPNILRGLNRLLAPLIKPPSTQAAPLESQPTDERRSAFINGINSRREPATPPLGRILNLARLSQLCMFLPDTVPIMTVSLLHSVESQSLSLDTIGKNITQDREPLLLLVYGYNNQVGVHSDTIIGFGAFLSRPDGKPCEDPNNPFQFLPVNRVSESALDTGNSSSNHTAWAYSNHSVRIQIHAQDKHFLDAHLDLHEKTRSGAFKIGNKTQLRFDIDIVELYTFGSEFPPRQFSTDEYSSGGLFPEDPFSS
ncbi:hypothetical protein K402DRAFT_426004 [Aulographum hederae CBS 113979]|uniref:TLDc domain-containing protein n=1 Tax=Aulographum hederae CBS 113979 TaxID=1176131 RepID=A0A6G1GIQ5_9PEZI|nr:hypothetical protein K402DRAFT_426004 [Aulographum hederae CBS 113979]